MAHPRATAGMLEGLIFLEAPLAGWVSPGFSPSPSLSAPTPQQPSGLESKEHFSRKLPLSPTFFEFS